MSICESRTLVKLGERHRVAISLPCNSWACPECGPRRQRQLRALAKGGEPTTFITLTVNPNWFETPDERARKLADAWRIVVKRACRLYGYRRIDYLWVYERTARGEPHAHVISRVAWIDQAWLSAQMKELIGAPIVDIRRVKSAEAAAWYVSKYITKEAAKFGSCKRYWKTRAWDLRPDDSEPAETFGDGPWMVVKQRIREVAAEWERDRWFPVWLADGHFEAVLPVGQADAERQRLPHVTPRGSREAGPILPHPGYGHSAVAAR